MISITLIAVLIAAYCARVKVKEDTATKEKNRQIQEEFVKLANQKEEALFELNTVNSRLWDAKYDLDSTQSKIKGLKEAENIQEELSRKAFENYCDILDNKYKEKAEDFNELITGMKDAYSNAQLRLIAETDEIREELDKMRSTRAAAIEAKKIESKIKSHISDYCLTFSQSELSDIKKLCALKDELNQPRILSMLLWQTYCRDRLKKLISSQLCTSAPVCGIYKITNIVTDECYIGQSVDVAKRATEHFKCGLGIDTPPGNKLYKAMVEYGVQSFSWELIEECSRDQLDEKEKFFIGLYCSCEAGYNGTVGNSKK